MSTVNETLGYDHKVLEGAKATRRYFAKFERIIGHLQQVAELSRKERLIDKNEAEVLQNYLDGLAHTFTALSYKYLMANRVGGQGERLLSIDKTDSGFPVFQELLQMAADAMQAGQHLISLPTQERLKKDMINHILSEQSSPTKLQFAMSQRLYYEHLAAQKLFLSKNDPKGKWLSSDKRKTRRKYLLHWAAYDSKTNLPAIYVMTVEDTGRKALPRDERRWPRVQSHLMAQAVSSLKLLTIARGFDEDFDHLHPKSLKRFHIGPMYSHKFTQQHGPLRNILADASGEPGLDWALSWTVESLVSGGTKQEKSGLFGKAERQTYKTDKTSLSGIESGATETRRSIILPHRAYQVLEEKNPAGFKNTRKYVVGKNSRILSY